MGALFIVLECPRCAAAMAAACFSLSLRKTSKHQSKMLTPGDSAGDEGRWWEMRGDATGWAGLLETGEMRGDENLIVGCIF